ncbi:MAG: FAD-binding protein [Actinobacteria bacterium]|nr:FAD-binding protein [Actinomycetota bacterium]
MTQVFTNWAGVESCTPSEYLRPHTTEEVQAAVTAAGKAGRAVRAVGAGHSFTSTAMTDGTLLSLENMNRVLDVDTSSGLTRVEAGITLHDLNHRLAEHGLALENLGDVDVQSIAGATQTGTHGTGAGLRNLSASIESLEIVSGDGSVVEVSAESDPNDWRAARVGLGALGIVTAATLRLAPSFVLHGVDRPSTMAEVLDGMDRLAAGNDHFEFYLFPHSDRVQTRVNNRTERPAKPRTRVAEWLNDIVLLNRAFGLTQGVAKRFPSRIPAVNRFVARAWGTSERFDVSYRIFASPRLVRFVEMEYAIPRPHAREAITAVHALASSGRFDVSFPIEVRFVAPDDALLSPAWGRETCYIAVHIYRGMEWEPYFRAVEEIMDSFDGRPHWGKRHFQTAATLAPRYEGFERFLAVRDRFDPGRRFANPYLEAVLGP